MPVSAEIKRAFASGTTILTANMRAARWLRREYALEQRGIGRRAWASPPIEDWDTWVRGQWQMYAQSAADAPLLLTSLQERSVWTRMQRDDAKLLVSPGSLAALAESAYALLGAYNAQSERRSAWGKTDAERFRQWAADFDRECARQKWISRGGLELKIANLLRPEALPKDVLLEGFERTTPAQEALLRALAENGVSAKRAELADADSGAAFVRVSGQREEITACAWWAREQIEANPEARIGVLAPDLSGARSEIERIFRRVLVPESDDVFASAEPPFEFSLGQPLANVPAIRAALLLLHWLDGPLREEEISWLLLSGFLHDNDDEYLELAKKDAKRRESRSLSLEITLQSFLRDSTAERLAVAGRLRRAQFAAGSQIGQNRMAGAWADLAQAVLREAGWPGNRKRDALHFQIVKRWERALDEIALLDFDGRRVKYGDFLQVLEEHAHDAIFSPESTGAPVQVMGALEASGQQFDAVWMLSADDASWPLRGRQHPLLPGDLQRRFRMPYADSANDFELTREVTAHIAQAAPKIVFSYAQRNQDGELRPSPLLPRDADWEDVRFPTGTMHERLHLEEIEDASGRMPWPVEQSPGGADVLKNQAACPFRAFAMKRLRAREFNRSEWGLTAAERGSLLHKTLEKIWSPTEGALHSLEDLQAAIRERRLREILRSAISKSFERFDTGDDPWLAAYLTSEQDRLLRLLEQWMEIEAGRVPFEVTACEVKLEDAKVGELRLNLRADRVDRVGDDDRILIDYKSGQVSIRDWQLPRPNDPQMPLYLVFGNIENVRGALFARIRADGMDLVGSVTDARAQVRANIKAGSALVENPYGGAMRDGWHDALLELAEEFLRGDAAVQPKNGKKTCAYCPLPGLCRVADLTSPLEEDESTEGNSDE